MKEKSVWFGLMGVLGIAALIVGGMWLSEIVEHAGYKDEYAAIAESVVVPEGKEEADTELLFTIPSETEPVLLLQGDEAPIEETSAPAEAPAAESHPQRVLVDFDALRRENSDTVGWLYIPGTKIHYPVVQARDNERYLDRSFKGKQASCGAIFVDHLNNLNPLDRNTVVYGHNMGSSSSLMFSTLTKYKRRSYCEKHPTFQFDTVYRSYDWRVLAVCHLDVGTMEQFNFLQQDFLSDAAFLEFVQRLKERALYDTGTEASASSRLLTLVTCDRSAGLGEDGRLILVAVQIS